MKELLRIYEYEEPRANVEANMKFFANRLYSVEEEAWNFSKSQEYEEMWREYE